MFLPEVLSTKLITSKFIDKRAGSWINESVIIKHSVNQLLIFCFSSVS